VFIQCFDRTVDVKATRHSARWSRRCTRSRSEGNASSKLQLSWRKMLMTFQVLLGYLSDWCPPMTEDYINDIRAPLKNLPETLDEKNKQIFRWYLHKSTIFYSENCACSAVARTLVVVEARNAMFYCLLYLRTGTTTQELQMIHYDVLIHSKVFCGCLVTISGLVVILAHFTVRGFLFSLWLWGNQNNNTRSFAFIQRHRQDSF
jgi:hypothetical protein